VDGVVGRSREAGEHVVKVSQGINAPAAAGFHDGVEIVHLSFAQISAISFVGSPMRKPFGIKST